MYEHEDTKEHKAILNSFQRSISRSTPSSLIKLINKQTLATSHFVIELAINP